MIINSLTLENFKSHKNTHIEFNENISLILGSNGAGKSSILEAISYCLFNIVDGKIDDLKRQPNNENDIVKKMKVSIEFTHNSTQYQLIREKTSQNKAILNYKENGEYTLKSSGIKNVTQDIESMLELDSKSFLNAVYIRQGDITDLIDKRASERKELIAKLLNIDSFEKAWAELKNLINQYEGQLQQFQGELNNKEEIELSINTLNELVEKNTAKLEELKPVQESLRQEVLQLESDVKTLEINKTNYESLHNTLNIYKDLLQKNTLIKEDNEKKLEELKVNEERIKTLEKEVQPLEHLEKLKETKQELDKNNEKIKQIREQINEIKKNTASCDNNKEAYDKYLSFNEELEELRSKQKEINEKYLRYNSIKAQIKEKETKRDTLRSEIQKASEDATALFNEYFSSPEDIESKVKDETEKTNQFLENLNNQIIENNKRISILENELKTTRKSLDDLEHTEDTCPICQSEISHEKHEELSMQYHDIIVTNELEIESLSESNKSQQDKIKDLEDYSKKIEKINIAVLKSKNEEFGVLIKEIKSMKGEIPEEFNNDDLLKNMDVEIQRKIDEINTLKPTSEAYSFAVKRLSELGNLEDLNIQEHELDSTSKSLKAQCHDIILRYGVKDNLDSQIKHLSYQRDVLMELKGKVQNKDDITNNIQNAVNEININNQNIENTKKNIQELNYSSEDYEIKNQSYRRKKQELDENIKITTTIETEIKKDQENIESKNKELDRLQEVLVEQQNLTDYIKTLNKIRDIYSKDGVQKDLRENVKPLIEKETLNIFNEFDFDYTGITLNEDYEPTLHRNDEELNIDMVSGGEKIVIALALRLGIAKVLSENKTDLLILDEPTIHLDEERRASLIEIIRKINFVPQMIVVTHDDEMEILSSNIIKIQKHNGISSIDNS